MQDLIGRSLGQYQIVRQIGSGGMATVFEATQASLNRSVAIKVLPPGLGLDATFRERFRREAKAAAGLSHPNIMPVYDFGQDGDIFYIVMILVEGGTLRDRIGTLSAPLALRLAAQVADALDYAHERGIVHRDVKPANVLLARADWALLADFGIARLTDAGGLTRPGAGIGTPDYMSPEQALGRPADRRSDVYSLGIMLYEMLTGQRPYPERQPFLLLRHHIEDPLPRASQINPAVTPEIEAILDRATAKDPEQRYPSAGDLKQAIDSIPVVTDPGTVVAIHSPSSATPVPPALDPPRLTPVPETPVNPPATGRRPLLFAAGIAVALVLCLLVGGITGFLLTRDDPREARPPARPPAGSTPLPFAGGTAVSPARVTPTATRPASSPTAVNLRTVNWRTTVQGDPGLQHPVAPAGVPAPGPYIATKDGKITGFALPSDVLVGDISGDNRDEAVVLVSSGGTAGIVGYLIYQVAANGQPSLATTRDTYQGSASIQAGQLVITQPISAGWEPNCCPSGIEQLRLRLTSQQLQQTARTEQGIAQARERTVQKFYELLSERKYREAYAFLSPSFQAANPFDRWSAGFQNTATFTVRTTDVPADSAVTIDLTATDRTASGTTTRRFTGRWTLIWSTQAKQWLLDRATIREN